MKTKLLFFLFFFLGGIYAFGQNYPNLVNYSFNGTPAYGVKIRTNLPFQNSMQMPTIKIEGYNFSPSVGIPANSATFNLNLVWYILNNQFVGTSVSSFGGSTPNIWLSNEDGKVVIFLDQRIYFQRFSISAFAQGLGEKPEYFQGWTVVDAALAGTQQKQVSYKNIFAGSVGIGTENPQAKLDVRGVISAEEVKVQVLSGSDFVFNEDYNLKPLSEVEAFVKENKHLPEIPSEKQMQKDGLNMNEFQIKLLQKIEELTLYTINQEKRLNEQQSLIELQNKRIEHLENR